MKQISPFARSSGFIVFVSLICAAILAHEIYRSIERRAEVIGDSRKDTANIMRSLAQHAAGMMRTADAILIGVVDGLEDSGGIIDDGKTGPKLRELMDRVQQIDELAIFDPEGNGFSTNGTKTMRLSAQSSPSFTFHRSDPSREIYVGAPIRSALSNSWVIPISRRLRRPDGGFLGFVAVGIKTAAFQDFYDQFEIGRSGAILLASNDATLLVRRPFTEKNIGRDMRNSVIFRDLLPKSSAGVKQFPSTTDGIVRINSYQRVEGYPLVVSAALATYEILAPWRRSVIYSLARTSLLCVIILLLGWGLLRREREFNRQAELLRATIERMHEGLIVVDRDDRISICNQQAINLLGLPQAYSSSRPTSAELFAYQEGRGEFANVSEEVRQRLRPRVSQGAEYSFERTRPGGEVIEIYTRPFESGGVIRTFRDVTLKKRADLQIFESERRFRLLAENMSDVIVMRRATDGACIYVSPSIFPLLGYTATEYEQLSDRDLLQDEDLTLKQHLDLSLHMADDRVTFLSQMKHKQGHWVWVDSAYSVVDGGDGEERHAVAVMRDVTQRQNQAAELMAAKVAAEAATAAKSQFLASMSHEVRTPLNGILGYTDILLNDDRLEGKPRREVTKIRSAGNALLSVVNDILDFSEIESGGVLIDRSEFSLTELIESTLEIVEPLTTAKGLHLGRNIDPCLGKYVWGDEGRLRQILLNLLNNAVKFTEEGSISILVARLADANGFQTVRFEISDSGIGIPQDKRAGLFERFSQIDSSVRRRFGGTGLGLAISKQLVELMGGEISCESSVGKGSVFSFALTLEVAFPHPLTPKAPDVRSASADMHVLLVEDIEMNREIAQAMIEAAGYSVDVAADGSAAVAAIQSKHYNLVLMDIQMPGMDGLTATRHIRAVDHPAGNVPIVAMTAHVIPAEVERFLAAGMNDHIGKPFKREVLYAKLAQWCRPRIAG